jgi:hypothetical protein
MIEEINLFIEFFDPKNRGKIENSIHGKSSTLKIILNPFFQFELKSKENSLKKDFQKYNLNLVYFL